VIRETELEGMSAAIATNRLRSQLKVAGIAHLQSSGSVATTSPDATRARNREIVSNLRVNDDLVRAIVDKRLVEFVYKTGRTRLVEPHDSGGRRGATRLPDRRRESKQRAAWLEELRRRSDPPLTRA